MICSGGPKSQPHPRCVHICGPQPRRIPLLGRCDPPECKRLRAFTYQATQAIWDLGCPERVVRHRPLQYSKFRENLANGKYPFTLDHSGGLSTKRLAWATEIELCDVAGMLPELVEGLTDKDTIFSTIASLAITDLISHTRASKIVPVLPAFTLAVKSALRLNNETIARRTVSLLQLVCKAQPNLGPNLVPFLHGLLMHLNQWVAGGSQKKGEIIYGQKKRGDLSEKIDALLCTLESIAGPERKLAACNIKRAIPTHMITESAM
ncbi:unnamed protein product [Schistocephalus solidus]|uniref:Parkin coregulated like n=1 Tax=Schistocephalus solidus TaxID=70667 RepID=A0A183SDW4_SCHSO|nr:unnamed protein product [Schistocephalus solidus]